MATEVEVIAQIERVLAKFPEVEAAWHSSTVASGFIDTAAYFALRQECIALGNFIYGRDHPQARQLTRTLVSESLFNLRTAKGMLQGAIEAIRHGLLVELRTQVLVDIKLDFLDSARQSLESGAKDAAGALACVVLEDSVKRLAQNSGESKGLGSDQRNYLFNIIFTPLQALIWCLEARFGHQNGRCNVEPPRAARRCLSRECYCGEPPSIRASL